MLGLAVISSLKASCQLCLLMISGYVLGSYPTDKPYLTPGFVTNLSRLLLDVCLPALSFYSVASRFSLANLGNAWVLVLWSSLQTFISYIVFNTAFNRINIFKKLLNDNKMNSKMTREDLFSPVTSTSNKTNIYRSMFYALLPTTLVFQNTTSFPLAIVEAYCEDLKALGHDSLSQCFSEGALYLFFYGLPWSLCFWSYGFSQIKMIATKTAELAHFHNVKDTAKNTNLFFIPYNKQGDVRVSESPLLCEQSNSPNNSLSLHTTGTGLNSPYESSDGDESTFETEAFPLDSALLVPSTTHDNNSDNLMLPFESKKSAYQPVLYEDEKKKDEGVSPISTNFMKVKQLSSLGFKYLYISNQKGNLFFSNTIVAVCTGIIVGLLPCIRKPLFSQNSSFAVIGKLFLYVGSPALPLVTIILGATMAHSSSSNNHMNDEMLYGTFNSEKRTIYSKKKGSKYYELPKVKPMAIFTRTEIRSAIAICLLIKTLVIPTLGLGAMFMAIKVWGDSSYVLPKSLLMRLLIVVEFTSPPSQTIIAACHKVGLLWFAHRISHIYIFMYSASFISCSAFCYIATHLFF